MLPPALTGDAPQRYDVRGIPMVSKKVQFGYAVNIKKATVSEKDLEPMLVDLAKVILKYQINKS